MLKTALMPGYIGSDHVFLGEMAILGRTRLSREPLFLRRIHPENSTTIGDHLTLIEWYTGAKSGGLRFKLCRLTGEYMKIIWRRELPLSPSQRIGCFFVVLEWIKTMHRGIIKELLIPFYVNGRPTKLNAWLTQNLKFKILNR